ncbi:MAG: hypothetical protein ucyna2_00484 [Candidatus Atelocyanobacterium thalassa isolate SIO64986]|uniref:Uncharacterized protein n=1 Tax=Candidatus Atelocyanobacterium thalassa isolate SIO64986 TaxID=1527444 RepID=A0A086CHE7_9CHRO|nr:MAG: hypothetical protein ucyna2_00484 [Candidatus Atelocyanobacterium thalassa isolate SIO64986]
MNDKIKFISKITIFSFLLSLAIKHLAPLYPVEPSQTNILIGIIVLPLMVFLLLAWKYCIQTYKF